MSQSVSEMVNTIVVRLEPELQAIRRDIHAHPELGWEEFRTTSIVATWLRDLGYEVLVGQAVCDPATRMGVPSDEILQASFERALAEGADPELMEQMRGGYTGVVATLRNGEGPVVGMRFDIDALPMQETDSPEHRPNQEGFASTHPQVMHACCHDVHTTIGMGVARIMMELRDSWSGTLRLVFQPAEEGVRGAKSMVSAGHLDDVQYLLSAHVEPGGQEGAHIHAGSGGTFATTKFLAYFHGKAAHAAGNPENGRNCVLAIATAALNISAMPRHSKGTSRINVGRIQAGSGANIIADYGEMELEVRGATTEINTYLADYTIRILESAAAMHGVTVDIEVAGESPSLESDDALMEHVASSAEEVGVIAGLPHRFPMNASDDYAFMCQRVQENGGQATYMQLMSPITRGMHTVVTDVDEQCLPRGLRVFVASALRLMPPQS
ncbi:amidohydrolase [Trueperella sp. LYQ143]|uniref:amidohydrolase n=1 Tax=unclassified Trueperella TaxID=2630174 RepID=UPI0039834C36